MPELRIPVHMAQGIAPESWLNEPQHAWFRDGYRYAATQSRAIPALSKCSAEEIEAAVWAIMRGAGLGDPYTLPRVPPYWPVPNDAQQDLPATDATPQQDQATPTA